MSQNPFDPSQFFQPVDLEALSKQWQDMMAGVNLPNVDLSAIQQAQQKNLEALAAANKAAVEGTQKLLQRQAEMMQTAFSEATSAAKSMSGIHDPQALAAAQLQLISDALTKSMANATEITEMVKQTQDEAAKAISERMMQSLEELKGQVGS